MEGKRNYYSIGFSISFGAILENLNTMLMIISNNISSMGDKHSFSETIDIIFGEELAGKDDKYIESNLKSITKIQGIVDSFNNSVKKLNENISKHMSYFPNLPCLKFIDKDSLLIELNRRFLKKYDNNESQKLADEVLDLKIISLLSNASNSVSNTQDFFKNLMDEVSNFNVLKKYAKGFREARAISSIGCSETSVFVVGRTVEALIDDLLINEMKKSNISEFDLENTKLENKIGKLKGVSIIGEKEFHMLQKLKFDRNDFGHPFEKELSFNEAKRIILDAFDLVKILEKKLN